ncbi:MAG: AraC family transcriptional regulator [Alphaproteobacteria bacterium]|nr:AraC family transcriptional regulator [Alphaproteobacteria bacterium]
MGHLSRQDTRRSVEQSGMGSQPLGLRPKSSRPVEWISATPDDAAHDVTDRQSANRSFASGIFVRATDGIETTNRPEEAVLQPGVCILLLLEGALDGAVDGSSFSMSARRGAVGRLWASTHPVPLRRTAGRGRYTRHLLVTVPLSWFEDRTQGAGSGGVPAEFSTFLRVHLAAKEWEPSAAAIRFAEDMLERSRDESILAQIAAERDTLGLMHDALSGFRSAESRPVPRHMRSRDLVRAQTAREMILRNLDGGLHLPEIARRTGMSVSTLQRVFRDCYGQTVMEFARVRRLEVARDQLERDGLSVGEAAGRAGYSSPANFATAFHREFGYPPSQVKERARRAALAELEAE